MMLTTSSDSDIVGFRYDKTGKPLRYRPQPCIFFWRSPGVTCTVTGSLRKSHAIPMVTIRLGPGTLYDNLKKLMDAGLVADAPPSSSSKRKSPKKDDDRRFYTLTKEGKDALAAEVDRLQSVVSEARLRLQEARARKSMNRVFPALPIVFS